MHTLLTIAYWFVMANLIVVIAFGLGYIDYVIFDAIRDWVDMRRWEREKAARRAAARADR